MNMDFNLLMNDIIIQARGEMDASGYEQLTTPEEVEEAFKRSGTTLVMVNSVCGCAGGIARPAAANAVHYDKRPDHLVTVFAGQDKEATAQARNLFGEDHLPSSPSFVLLKDGKWLLKLAVTKLKVMTQCRSSQTMQSQFEEHCEEIITIIKKTVANAFVYARCFLNLT